MISGIGTYQNWLSYSFKRMKVLLTLLLLTATAARAQQVAVLKYEELQERVKQHDKGTLVVNFWATWCVPCIEEMPLLMKMNEKYKDSPAFKMLLVSLDSKDTLERLPDFLKKHQVKAEVVLLDDNKRMNEWIPDMDEKWQGNLPVTFVYHKGEKVAFIDGEATEDQLESIAGKYVKPLK